MAKLGLTSWSPATKPIHLSSLLFYYPCVCPPPTLPSCSTVVLSAQYPCSGEVSLSGPCPMPCKPNLDGCRLPPGKLGYRFGFHALDPTPLLISVFGFFRAMPRPSVKGWMEMTLPRLQGRRDSGLATGIGSGRTDDPNQAKRVNPKLLLETLGRRMVFCSGVAGYVSVRSCQNCYLRRS